MDVKKISLLIVSGIISFHKSSLQYNVSHYRSYVDGIFDVLYCLVTDKQKLRQLRDRVPGVVRDLSKRLQGVPLADITKDDYLPLINFRLDLYDFLEKEHLQ